MSTASWRISRSTGTAAVLWIIGFGVLALVSDAGRPVVLPMLAALLVLATFLAHLYFRDGQLPVFDVGAVTALMTAVYVIIPLLGFWLGGLRWTPYSYHPLWLHNPGPFEVGAFAWRHVLYLASFCAAYAVFRGAVSIRSGPTRILRPSGVAAIVVLILLLTAYFQGLRLFFGVSYHPSYADLKAASASAQALPHVVRQLSHNLFAIMVLLKIAAVLWLFGRWHDGRWRTVLFGGLALEGILTLSLMGGRTWYAMLVLATGLLYHRIVRPLSPIAAALIVVLVLGGTLIYGVARDVRGGLRTVAEAEWSPWATMNEFQAFFGIAYDLHARQAAGTVGHIPWQVYASDLISLVPSQLLPFDKIDPCLGVPVVDGTGLGCVQGVIAHGIVGLDWIEFLVRGLVLGVLFAVIHRWYAARQDGYWTTLFYLCMCIWGYYTFRGSSFYFLYNLLYRFLPMLVAIRLVQFVVRNLRRALPAPGL
jgi:hypothetical protein